MDKEASLLLAPAVVGYEYVKLTAVDHAREWREPSLTLTQFCALFKTVKILKTLEDVPLMNTTLAPPLQFKLQKMLHECKMYLLIGRYLLIYILNRKSYLGCHFSCLISSQLLFIGHSCQCQCQVHISLIETRIIWRKRPLTTHWKLFLLYQLLMTFDNLQKPFPLLRCPLADICKWQSVHILIYTVQ